MKTVLISFVISLILISGCKELSEFEQLKDDLIKAKIKIAGLQIKIQRLKLNMLDVLEADKEVDKIRAELTELEDENNKLKYAIIILETINEILIEYVEEFCFKMEVLN